MMASFWVRIFALALLFSQLNAYIPPKYRNTKEDRAKYCDICTNVIIALQGHLLSQTTGAGKIETFRIGADGERTTRENKHLYPEELTEDGVGRVCTHETRFPKRKDKKMCEEFSIEYEDALIDVMKKNDRMEMRRFCRQKVSKEDCQSVAFPESFIEQMDLMKSLRAKVKAEL